MNIALVGGKLIDGLGGHIDHGTLLIEGNRIRDVVTGPNDGAYPGYFAIDCRGKSILPGLFDVHTHVGGGDVVPGIDDYRLSRRLDEPIVMHAFRAAEAGRRALQAGFTTLRDMSARDYVDVHLRDAVSEGLLAGPRILTAGPGITMTGGHVWPKCVEVDGPDEIRKEIRRQIKGGADWIKIMGVTGGMASKGQDIRRTQFTPEEIDAAASETHRLSRRCAAHCHGLEGISLCIDSGVDTIEHGTFLDARTAARMAEKNLYLVPTLLNAYQDGDGADEALKKRQAQMQQMGIVVPAPEERIGLARKAGVKILAGTDCGGNTRARFGLHGIELLMLVRCGMAPMEAIQAATGLAAEAMGIADEAGSLRPGLAADVVVVDGDPLADIAVLTPVRPSIAYVIRDGQIVHHRLFELSSQEGRA